MDIDEQCIPFKGRHKCKCYNPKKPETFHFKAFGLNDAITGYLSNFYLYGGKAENRPADVPATLWPLKKLLLYAQYISKNHILATDNWYSSILAAEFVKGTIHAEYLGTIKVNKSHLPADGKFPKKGRNKKRRGEMKQMMARLSSHPNAWMYFVAWMDNNPVHLISTIPSHVRLINRSVETANGGYRRMEFTQPSVIDLYNKSMGGTDLGDQLLSYYRSKLRAKSWIPRVLTHLLNASVINAYILYKSYHFQNMVNHRYSVLDFLLNYMKI